MQRSGPARIGLVVDHPLRDLPGMLLLALELAGRGIETALVPLYDQGLDVPLLGLDALVLNFARHANEDLAREYARLGIPLYVLDTEGGILSDKGRAAPRSIAAYVRDSAFSQLLTGYLFWGEVMKEAFEQEQALPVDRLHVTGCPRFDYYTAAFAGLEPPKRTGHILVNTNFSIVNPRFSTNPAGDADALREVGFADDYIARLQEENLRVMTGMTDLVRQLATDLPNQHFVLRPHPFERSQAYSEALGHLPNVEIDGTGPVLDALRGAHAMVHLNCGTAVEALMLGLPALSPEWINSDFLRTHASLPSRASRSVHAYDEMRTLLSSADPAQGFDMADRYRDIAWPFFHANDGLARKRAADVLDHGRTTGAATRRIALGSSLRGSRPGASLAQIGQAALANLLGSRRARDLRIRLQPTRGAKRFGESEVLRQIELVSRHLDLPRPGVASFQHPITGVAMATVLVTPARSASA